MSEKVPDYLDVSDDENDKANKTIQRKRHSSSKHKHHHHRRSRSRHSSHKHHRRYSSSSSKSNNDSIDDIKPSSNRQSKWTTKNVDPFSDIQTLKIKSSTITKIDNSLKKDLTVKTSNDIVASKRNFNPSGLLAMQTNTVNNVVLKYTVPLDKANSDNDWRLYQFEKNSKDPSMIHPLINIDHVMIGKDIRICDVILKTQSASRQHAVIQFRKKINNTDTSIVPYIIDLESTNGTFINAEKIEASKYYELKNEDVLNFGDNSVDYVLMLCEKK